MGHGQRQLSCSFLAKKVPDGVLNVIGYYSSYPGTLHQISSMYLKCTDHNPPSAFVGTLHVFIDWTLSCSSALLALFHRCKTALRTDSLITLRWQKLGFNLEPVAPEPPFPCPALQYSCGGLPRHVVHVWGGSHAAFWALVLIWDLPTVSVWGGGVDASGSDGELTFCHCCYRRGSSDACSVCFTIGMCHLSPKCFIHGQVIRRS